MCVIHYFALSIDSKLVLLYYTEKVIHNSMWIKPLNMTDVERAVMRLSHKNYNIEIV